MKKEYSNIRVLVFGSRGRQALPVCRGFRKLGCHVTSYCLSKLDTGFLTKYTNKRILYKSKKSNGLDYLNYGLELIKTGVFDLVVPLVDETASFLSQHKKELSKYAKIAVNDWDVFEKILDKSKTMKVCEENGIPAPKTIYCEEPSLDIFLSSGLSFPIVVKPKTSIGSIGFNIVRDIGTLKKLLDSYNNDYGPLLIQEYIEQGDNPQYGAEMFRDRDGNIKMALVAKVVRWYPLDGGSRLCSISIHNDEIINNSIKLLNALNWNGYANIDLVWDEKKEVAKILEINGRTGASLKLDFISGLDVCRLIIQNEFGLPVEEQLDYKDDKIISCFMVDILWLIHSKKRFSAKPSWFNRWNIKDVIFSFSDPLPSFGFFIQSIASFKENMRKRKRIKNEK